MSIHKGDFPEPLRSRIEEVSEQWGVPFSSAVKVLIGLGLRRNHSPVNESLTGETIEGVLAVSSPDLGVSAEIKKINPEEMGSGEEGPGVNDQPTDPDLVEALRASLLGQKPKRAKRQAVPIPDPPASIDSPELRALLPDFAAYRKALGTGKGLKTTGQWDYLFRHLAACAGRQHAVLGLKYAMAKGWMGLEADYLNGKSWATIASELGLSLEAEKPAPAPADFAARNLARAIEDARNAIPKLAPAEDGWTSKSRTVFFEDLDACKTEVEVEAHLAACHALCDRLRAMGAFPLRRPTQPGEILPAGGGGPLAVDLQQGWVGPAGRSPLPPPAMLDPLEIGCDRGCAVGGPCAFWPDPCPAADDPLPTCPHGTPYRYPCGYCDADVVDDMARQAEEGNRLRTGRPGLTPCGGDWWCCKADYPNHEPSCPNSNESVARRMEHAAHSRLAGKDTVSPTEPHPYRYGLGDIGCAVCGQKKDAPAHRPIASTPYELAFGVGVSNGPALAADLHVKTSPDGPAVRIAGVPDLAPSHCPRCGRPSYFRYTSVEEAAKQSSLCWGESTEECDRLAALRKVGDMTNKQRAKVADGQHAYAHNALSGRCVWCGQSKDHIRHYLPQELPFNEQA